MLRRTLVAASVFAAILVPAAATAQVATTPKPLRHAYLKRYHEVAREQGNRVPGKDIVNTGTARELRESITVLDRMLAPASAPTPSAANGQTGVQQSPAATTTAGGGGAGGLPSCASESGGDYSTGPSNTNPKTGATGRYQEIPQHRQPGGLCYGMALSPGGQDRCAAAIYRAQGTGAWTGCGG